MGGSFGSIKTLTGGFSVRYRKRCQPVKVCRCAIECCRWSVKFLWLQRLSIKQTRQIRLKTFSRRLVVVFGKQRIKFGKVRAAARFRCFLKGIHKVVSRCVPQISQIREITQRLIGGD